MKVYLETYGCTLNQADSDIMGGILRHAGFRVARRPGGADVVVLNTCTVKGRTENKIISRIEALGKQGKRIVVAGCLSINKKRVRDACPEAVLVHPGAVSFIADAVRDAAAGKIAEYRERAAKEGLPRIFTKPILRIPIQEGCVGNCHFCQTKLARPYLMSYSPGWIRSWVEEGVRKGAKEIQLTGMDSGAYGLDIGTDLAALLGEVRKVKGDVRIRLGMINPGHAKKMLPKLLDIFEDRKFYKFFHLPVQTGSEKVRKEMNRAHSVADFRAVVRAIRKRFPDACISTDIIVGYPTETESDFLETVRLVKEVRPDIVNLSKFASRRGTKAAELREIATDIVKRRSTELSAIVRMVGAEKNREYEGRKMEMLVLEKGNGKQEYGWKGRASNYKQVCVLGKAKIGERVDARIIGSNHGSLFGKRI
ncbi:MAG: tRNA (N(6)-L-threonylcarbamoyladenosine(37)-C(2))-methylthiotransferase [Candidatus ainarchaeum sp.]|nr:tRNA (N(6)-L-threonylcarbamoyladenosine(37)-C(2))-methylthiotransferase [Candidatus ainarchaeum sp.]MDD5096535.1 tRNA (N(6)-L-threonylcarbamoyladenosine(37)-C(2))-methylthiotransferase [Candidatus ainarchaeum sp.]